MRVTSLLKKLLGIKQIVVEGARADEGELVVAVRPSWRRARCSGCGRRRPGYDELPRRRWRHLDFGGIAVLLEYGPRRVECPRCGVVVERVPWAVDGTTRFTEDFEQQITYLAQRCDKTSIGYSFRIAWATVGSIIARVVKRNRPPKPLANLQYIGVDELSYRKQHHYVTVVSDHQNGQIVWGAEGKGADTLLAFLDELGEQGLAQIKVVTMDMSQAYIKAVRERLPLAQIVFDRFHVQQLVNAALDETRRAEWQRLRKVDEDAAKDIKNTRWALLKNPWKLTPTQEAKLATLQQVNSPLYRAYLLKESFAEILDRHQPGVVRRCLDSWLSWAARSRLPAFVHVAKTIRLHLDDIIAYIRWRLTNGLTEGLNNKARLATRRAYGYHSASAVIAMIMLCCSGITIPPVIKRMAS